MDKQGNKARGWPRPTTSSKGRVDKQGNKARGWPRPTTSSKGRVDKQGNKLTLGTFASMPGYDLGMT